MKQFVLKSIIVFFLLAIIIFLVFSKENGRYQIFSSANSPLYTFLIDTRTGKVWQGKFKTLLGETYFYWEYTRGGPSVE
jgi:hypothetical protein